MKCQVVGDLEKTDTGDLGGILGSVVTAKNPAEKSGKAGISIFFKALAMAAAGLLVPALPGAAASGTVTLPPIIVTAGRVAQTAEETLASVTVITRRDIERRQTLSVPDLLRGVPGISLSNNGGPGKSTSVFLRGTNSDHVLVLIDGVKVGSATLGSTAFEHIPVEQIERIEVVRGPRSSLYGSEAIGGVIQIFTRKGGGVLKPSFSLGAGSYHTYKGSATVSGGGAESWFNVSLSGVDTRGFNACNGEPNVAGCFTREPDQDGYRNLSGNLRAGHRFDSGAEVDLHWLRTEGDTEFDGAFENESETVQQILSAGLRLMPTDIWTLSLKAGRSRDESDNFKDDAFSSRFDTERDTLSWQNDLTPAPEHLLTLGVDYQDDRVSGSTSYTVAERDNVGLFGQYLGRFGMHELQASLRGDDNEQFGGQITGSLAWGYDFGGGLRITASYGTAFKAPTFNELYFPGFGNPNLSPEESSSIEAGIGDTTAPGSWSVHLYQTDIDDLIAFDADIFAPANIDSARIRGLEAILDARLGQWDLSGNLTLLDPINKGDGPNRGKRLPRRAKQSLRLDLDRSFGRYSLGATLLGVGRRYDDIANDRELDGYITLDLRGEYRLAQAWRVQARIVNLFDEEYETAAFYNQPGRSFFVTLRYQP